MNTAALEMPYHDLDAISDAIKSADKHNESYRAGVQRAEFGVQLAEAEKQRAKLTAEIEAIDAEKKARLAAAKMPLGGLSATEEGIYLHGHPISRASGRDRLTVALSIAFANCDPDFPLVCCDGGEQFDAEWLPHIEKMAEDAGVVVILTRVSKDANCTVIMQSGEALTVGQYTDSVVMPEFPPAVIEEVRIDPAVMDDFADCNDAQATENTGDDL